MKKPLPPPPRPDEKTLTKALMTYFGDRELMMDMAEAEKRHLYWEKFRHKFKNRSVPAETLWHLAKGARMLKAQYLELYKDRLLNFQYTITDQALRHLHQFDLNMGGVLATDSVLPERQDQRLLISTQMEEAIASSQIEGAVATREVAKRMLLTGRAPKDHSERMILNNYLTMRELVKHKRERLTPELICHFHRLITGGTLKNAEKEGVFRDNDDVVVEDATTGEEFYRPPEHKHLKGMLKAFCEFANADDEKQFMHPIVRGIILHFLIGYIHPFVDGNGRTARALFYWYLLKRGYWLVEFLTISRIILRSSTGYAHAYLHTEYDENDLTYFIDFNLDAMNQAMSALKEHLERKMEERKKLPQLLTNTSFNSRQAEILLWLDQEPLRTLTIKEVSNAMRTTLQTARTDLNGLLAAGFLSKRLIDRAEHFFASPNFALKLKGAIRS